jgi:hypothetical protein
LEKPWRWEKEEWQMPLSIFVKFGEFKIARLMHNFTEFFPRFDEGTLSLNSP